MILHWNKFNEGLDDEGFVEVDRNSNDFYQRNRAVDFPKETLDKIKEFIKEYDSRIVIHIEPSERYLVTFPRFFISSYQDEWFMLIHRSSGGDLHFYECDQTEGVINCLKKILIKK